MRKPETACLVVNFSRMLAKNSVASLISFSSFACFASLAEIFSSCRCLAFVSPRTMRFRLAFAVDATGKVVNVGSTGYGSLISHETVHCICKCHVLRVYEIENRFQIIYRRRLVGECLLGDSTAHVTTQNLYWITHRESNLLRRPFQRQSITVPGTQTSVSFLQKLPGVAQTSLFASASAPLGRLTLPRRSGDRAKVVGDRAPSAINPPTASSLDLRVCEFSARKSRSSRRARVRNFARVAISRRCRSEGFRIINRTCLARVHRRSHRRTANPVKRIHLPSFPRARAPCAFARVTKRRR